MAMTPGLAERALSHAGETYDFVRSITGAPTPEQMRELQKMVEVQEQLNDALARSIEYVRSALRNGLDAPRTKRLSSGWQDAQELDAVQQRIRIRRIKRRM